jgi:SAM-dependent methyltransferase
VTEDADGNAAIWKSEEHVSSWLSEEDDRERRRHEQRRLMANLLPFDDDEPFVFVDLGAGTGAAGRGVLDRYPAASALLAEYSPQMAEAGTRAMERFEGRYRYVEFDLATGPWPTAIPDRVDAVVSSMCLHHLPDPRKEELCREVFARLAPGGWFLDLDVVTADDPSVDEAWRRADDRRNPEAARRRAHPTREEQHRQANHTRYISPLSRRLGFLRSAGFLGVDTYWKQLESVLIGGMRPR